MSTARTRARAALLVSGWLAGSLAACAGGRNAVDLGRLPASPIALLYRDEALANKRVDAIHDLEKRNQPSEEQGVVRLETLDALFGGTPDAERRLRDLYGHLALFDGSVGAVKVVEGLPPGAKPLAWSSDRTRLVMAGRFRELQQLFVWERATGAVEILTSGPAEHPMGCFTGDGRLVAVESMRVEGTLKAHLLVSPKGGVPTALKPLTRGPADVLPTCSATQPLVAYATVDPDDGKLLIAALDLDAPDAQPRILGHGTDPAFSPDGAWIVYAAQGLRGSSHLWRVRPDGTGRTPLGTSNVVETHPAVSPDGAYVAYIGVDPEEDKDRQRLRVRRFDGTGDRPFLTEGDADFPVW